MYGLDVKSTLYVAVEMGEHQVQYDTYASTPFTRNDWNPYLARIPV